MCLHDASNSGCRFTRRCHGNEAAEIGFPLGSIADAHHGCNGPRPRSAAPVPEVGTQLFRKDHYIIPLCSTGRLRTGFSRRIAATRR